MALFGERFSDLYKWGILAVYTFIVDFIILMSLTLGRGLEKQSLFDKSVFHYILILSNAFTNSSFIVLVYFNI